MQKKIDFGRNHQFDWRPPENMNDENWAMKDKEKICHQISTRYLRDYNTPMSVMLTLNCALKGNDINSR